MELEAASSEGLFKTSTRKANKMVRLRAQGMALLYIEHNECQSREAHHSIHHPALDRAQRFAGAENSVMELEAASSEGLR